MNQEYAYGMWVVVAFNVGLFLFFILSFLTPKGRLEWRSLGVVTEERATREKFGTEYEIYAAQTPRFFPPMGQWKDFLWTSGSE